MSEDPRGDCSPAPRRTSRRGGRSEELQHCEKKTARHKIPATNSFRNPSPTHSSVPSSPACLTKTWPGSSGAAVPGPGQTQASQRDEVLGTKDAGARWREGVPSSSSLGTRILAVWSNLRPLIWSFYLYSKLVLFTSTYSDNSLALTFFSSLMMLHVTLIRLQGSRKLHFSFQIATLSAREGDQKENKK